MADRTQRGELATAEAERFAAAERLEYLDRTEKQAAEKLKRGDFATESEAKEWVFHWMDQYDREPGSMPAVAQQPESNDTDKVKQKTVTQAGIAADRSLKRPLFQLVPLNRRLP